LQSQNYIVVKTESSPFDINIVKRKSIRKSATTVSTDLADERCPSGVEGLDDILAGGLPRDCFYLVQGDPGSGKTTLALQFLLEGVRRGEKFF
jgi:predicted ATP-dependent serine protease